MARRRIVEEPAEKQLGADSADGIRREYTRVDVGDDGVEYVMCECGLRVAPRRLVKSGDACPKCQKFLCLDPSYVPDTPEKRAARQASIARVEASVSSGKKTNSEEIVESVEKAADSVVTEVMDRAKTAKDRTEPLFGKQAGVNDQGAVVSFGPSSGRSMPSGEATVTVTWGEEMFGPKQFHMWRVGPFSATVLVLAHESLGAAMDRAMRELTAFAEKQREAKRAAYFKFAGLAKE